MKRILAHAAAAVTVAATALFAGPAAPAAAAIDYGTYSYRNEDGYIIGQAHIQQISGNQFDIAVADQMPDGVNICVAILPTDPQAYYCDLTGPNGSPGPSDGKASHYRIYYSWFQASVCRGHGGDCRTYVRR